MKGFDTALISLTPKISPHLFLATLIRVCFAQNYFVFKQKSCDLQNLTESVNSCIMKQETVLHWIKSLRASVK